MLKSAVLMLCLSPKFNTIFPENKILRLEQEYRVSDYQRVPTQLTDVVLLVLFSKPNMWSCSDILSSLFVFPSNPLHVEKSIFTQPEDGADGKQLHGV